MTAPKIRFEYNQLDEIAGRFAREADETRRARATLEQRKSELQAGDWIGAGAQAFYAEMDALVLPALARLSGALRAAADGARAIRSLAERAESDAASALRRVPAQANWAPAPAPAPKPTPPPTRPQQPLAAPAPMFEANPPAHGERAPAPFLLSKGLSLGLALIAHGGPKALRSAAKTGGPLVSLALNAVQYRSADTDGSFDWSRFMIANAKDLALGAARAPLAAGFDALAGTAGTAGGATVGTLLGPPGAAVGGAMGGLGEAILAAPLSIVAAWTTTVVLDTLIGDQIVDGLDAVYQRGARPYLQPASPRPAPVTRP